MSKDKHTVQTGIHVGRVGVYVYAREYIGNIIVGNLGHPLMQ